MSQQDQDPTATLATLRESLDSAEETLKPLLEKKWTETTSNLDTLDRAKMDVLVSYAINDMIWVYLKMKGVDPSTHEVSAELERIRTYYGKVKAVEEPESRRTTKIDKAAAGRIIKHSLPSQRQQATTSAAAAARAQAEAAVAEQLGTSHRFRHIAKDSEVEIEAEDTDEDEEEDDEAEGLLNDLDEEIRAKQRSGEEMEIDDGEKKKRKRAEDFGY